MNEKPSFYPKHLARHYVSSDRSARTKSLSTHASSPLKDVTNENRRERFAPAMTSSTVCLPAAPKITEASGPAKLEAAVLAELRAAFDGLDVQKKNRVRFQDAVTWCTSQDSGRLLPEGVVGGLSKTATPDGYLTFERFCAGVQIARIRSEASDRKKQGDNGNPKEMLEPSAQSLSSASATLPGTRSPNLQDKKPVTYQSPISPIRRRKGRSATEAFTCSPLSRTNSLPTLAGPLRAVDIVEQDDISTPVSCRHPPSPTPSEPWGGRPYDNEKVAWQNLLSGPPKPPRDPSRLSGIYSGGSTHSLPGRPQAVSYPNISSHIHVKPTDNPIPFIWKSPPPEMRYPSCMTGQRFSVVVDDIHPRSDKVVGRPPEVKAFNNSHSFINKLLFDKKRGLEDGLALIESLRGHYLQKLAQLDHEFGQNRADVNPAQTESFQDRLRAEMQTIHELNIQLASFSNPVNPFLGAEQHRGRSLHRVDHQKWLDQSTDRQILRLQDQNRQLTAEVGKQGQVIYELEQEKRSLIRQLFQQSSSTGSTDTIKMKSTQHSRSQPHLQNKYGVSNSLF